MVLPAIAILTPLVLLILPTDGGAYVDGAPPGHTGGFEEPTCTSCHFGNPVNDSAGTLEISAPSAFVPGEEYPLEIRLRHPELERAGFQLSARFAKGSDSGDQAGVLSPGAGVEIVEEDGVQYARHTRDGVEPREGHEIEWRFRWKAPAAAEPPVVFHVAANAGNYDDSEFGDFVYRRAVEAKPVPPE
ncbi:MAG: choice-of-anchor V domain-containing protein [Thermoanaerobaculia bacterium]|nr:choice-of-anchor V domain-containing protein [Thermoanaerobaculia bacterium]